MKQASLKVAEIVLLFASLFFTIPYVPSTTIERLPLLPAAAFAVASFAGSRFIRWRPRYFEALCETVAFAGFVWGANAVANLIYSL